MKKTTIFYKAATCASTHFSAECSDISHMGLNSPNYSYAITILYFQPLLALIAEKKVIMTNDGYGLVNGAYQLSRCAGSWPRKRPHLHKKDINCPSYTQHYCLGQFLL